MGRDGRGTPADHQHLPALVPRRRAREAQRPQRHLQLLAGAPHPALAAVARRRCAVHPGLDHHARSRAVVAARRDDGRRVDRRVRADRLPGVHLQAGRPEQPRAPALGDLHSAALDGADVHRVRAAIERRRERAQATGNALMSDDAANARPDRNLALELVRTTEAAALSAARLVGKGDKEAADQAAVDAMRIVLDGVQMDGTVVIGEGEKDEAPMLYNGERVGDGQPPEVDVAVDPLEGTTLTAKGQPNALAVIALSERNSMFDPGPCVYMEKISGAGDIADLLDLDRPLGETLGLVAERRGKDVRDVMVVMLDRPRNEDAMAAVRGAGARLRLISHGDVSASLLAVSDNSPARVMFGAGRTPEELFSAAATKCLAVDFGGRLWPRDDEEREAAVAAGYDLGKQLDQDALVRGNDCFFAATGVTDGDGLQGVRSPPPGAATTESLVMRSRTHTVRRIQARHNRAKLRAYNAGLYG